MESYTKEYQKVMQYLKDLIAGNELMIGSRIPSERELTERLGISRNSVREALRMLEHMGFLECRQGSGNYMVVNAEQSFTRIFDMLFLLKQVSREEICSFRCNLDKALCFSLIEAGDTVDLSLAEKALEEERQAQTMEEQIEADRAFHFSLIEATQNQMWSCISNAVVDVYRNCIDASIRHADDSLKAKFQELHERILESIKKRDKVSCEKWIDLHYHMTEEDMQCK